MEKLHRQLDWYLFLDLIYFKNFVKTYITLYNQVGKKKLGDFRAVS